MLFDIPCYFCKGKTESMGSYTNGIDPFTHLIRHCKACNSEQRFIYGTDNLLRFTLDTKSELNEYYISYDLRIMKLCIYQVVHLPEFKWIPCVETTLRSFPAWLAPNFISEQRIQTLKVFS